MKRKAIRENQICVRLETALTKQLKEEAEKLGHSLASYIRYLLVTRHERAKKP